MASPTLVPPSVAPVLIRQDVTFDHKAGALPILVRNDELREARALVDGCAEQGGKKDEGATLLI